MKFLRKLLGFKPRVGDKVKGFLDWSVQYEGIVTKVPSKESALQFYTVSGKVILNKDWTAGYTEKIDEDILVPSARIQWA